MTSLTQGGPRPAVSAALLVQGGCSYLVAQAAIQDMMQMQDQPGSLEVWMQLACFIGGEVKEVQAALLPAQA